MKNKSLYIKNYFSFFTCHFSFQGGSLMIELLLTIGLSAIILPGLLTGLVASREGIPQQEQRMQAIALLKETEAAVKSARDDNWTTFSTLNTLTPYHPQIVNNRWALSAGASTSANLTQQVILTDVYRNAAGAIVADPTGNTLDPSTKKAEIMVSWIQPNPLSITSTIFLTRTTNLTASNTTLAEFTAGTTVNTQVTNDAGGEIKLANNNKAKWCDPGFAAETINLPDGPPVAVAATASATTSIPNDVFVATAPTASSSVKLAYVNVTADTESPTSTLRGKFTMNATEFSSGYSPQTGTGLDNNFYTTDVKYYKAASGRVYALLGTNLPDKEVIAVLVNDNDSSNDSNATGEFQDPVNKIYKYKTFFNTKRYSTITTNDQSPYGYGASTIAVLGDRGYVASGGYLYVFNLANIDSKSTASGLDMYGCRILIDGYECRAGAPGTAEKYDAGQSGTSWSNDATPIHDDCSDGGNVELRATNDIFPVNVGNNTYVYVAVGGVTVPEFNIVNVTTHATGGSALTGNSCGTASGNSSWRKTSTYDFNNEGGTEEASNSVFAKSDGTRAYISSNGGVDANNDGDPDSKQFYVLNTTNKSSPSFLTGSPNSPTFGPTSGSYYGTGANAELFPRRSLTVLNGDRAVLVGSDGTANGNDAQEYQVLNMDDEETPRYCSGLNFDTGFNDLTSVSEADYENYVYMVANTTDNELRIIQGGPDNAIYLPSGTFESQPFDTASIDGSTILRTFNRMLANIIQPATTSVKIQVAIRPVTGSSCSLSANDYKYVGPDGSETSFYTSANSIISDKIPFGNYYGSAYINPERCFRYKVYLESPTNQTQTPVLQDINWNYSQ